MMVCVGVEIRRGIVTRGVRIGAPRQGVLTGVVPMRDYFAPGNLLTIIGIRGMSKVLLNKFRVPHPRAAPQRVAQA